MNRLRGKRAFLLCMTIFLFVVGSFSGCAKQPPSVTQIEKQFSKYESDFIIISNYLASISAETVSIETDSEELYIDFTYETIGDSSILDSLHRLCKAGCSSIYLNRSNNSICFVLWKTGIVGDADAGILYALDTDERNLPTTQYLTELQPLQTHFWYYYIADYEVWRNQHKGGQHSLQIESQEENAKK